MEVQNYQYEKHVSVRMSEETWRAMRILAATQDKTVSSMLREHAEQLTAPGDKQ